MLGKHKSKLMKLLFSLIVFIISYILSWIILKIVNLESISAISLETFSFFLSLVITVTFISLYDDPDEISIPDGFKKISPLLIVIILVFVALVFSFFAVFPSSYDGLAFQEWSKLSIPTLILSLIILTASLYIPAFIVHKIFLYKFNLSNLEKLAFYPVLSALILTVTELFGQFLRINIPYRIVFVFLSVAVLFIIKREKKNSDSNHGPSVISLRTLGVIAAIGFNLFIFYSAIGAENAFIRGDMWGNAHDVAFLGEKGLSTYINSPTHDYPPLYSIFWCALSQLMPIPYINEVLIIAFFNHIFSVLALYVLAKVLFGDSRRALLTVILWTTLSGFSWSYLISNPASLALSQNELLRYISGIAQNFGVHSGSIISPIYADDHALTRLWSIGLLFLSIAALLKAHSNKKNLAGGLIIFSAGLIQILLGHINEVPLLALALFTIILFRRNLSSNFTKLTSLITISSVIIGALSVWLIFGPNKIFMLISFTPLFALVSGLFVVKLSGIIGKRVPFTSLSEKISKITGVFSFSPFYIYGLMWIAFLISEVWIGWAVTTIWYYPAIEWGFLGFMAVLGLTLVWRKKEKLTFGIKFLLLLLALQLVLLVSLNYVNFNFVYIQPAYSIQPILFLPLLALLGSQAFPILKQKQRFLRKVLYSVVVMFLILLFCFGSLDHIISSSFWKTNNGWWWYKPLNPSTPDYEFINYLHDASSGSSSEFVGTFYGWETPSSYIVYPSGVSTLSQPLIDIFSSTNDSREIYLLTQVFPINHVLVSNEQPMLPSSSLNFDGVDDYIEVNDSSSLNSSVFTIEAWIKLDSYSQYLSPIYDRATSSGGFAFWIGGNEHDRGRLALNGGLDNDVVGNLCVNLNEWTHVAVVWNGESVTFYKNGVSESLSGFSFKGNDSLTTRIGNVRWTFGGQYFDGNIWQVRFFNRPLSENELLELFRKPDETNHNGLSLWFRTDEESGNIIFDKSESANDGRVFGAKLQIGSYLAYAINSANPLFTNSKYTLYGLDQINLSKTEMLPNSDDFLTVEKMEFDGNLKLTDSSGKVTVINAARGEIFPMDDGKILVRVQQLDNQTNNIVSTTPLIELDGNVSLFNMKSTWGYFYEIRCTTERLSISGKVSMNIFNSFKSRLYIDPFEYAGEYEAYPYPEYLRQDYAKNQILEHYEVNHVDPIKVVSSSLGITWTLIIIIASILIFLLEKRRGAKNEKIVPICGPKDSCFI